MAYNNAIDDYQYLSIIKTDPSACDVDVSYKYDSTKDCLIITGFHIDKQAVMQQHLLAMLPKHHLECKCLDLWNDNSNIYTHLTIGDPNQHQIDKQRLEECMKEVKRSKEQIKNTTQQFLDHCHRLNSVTL